MGGEEQHGERQDHHESEKDEAESAHHRPEASSQSPRAVDRQLGRGRTGQEIRRRDGVFELVLAKPASSLHAQLA